AECVEDLGVDGRVQLAVPVGDGAARGIRQVRQLNVTRRAGRQRAAVRGHANLDDPAEFEALAPAAETRRDHAQPDVPVVHDTLRLGHPDLAVLGAEAAHGIASHRGRAGRRRQTAFGDRVRAGARLVRGDHRDLYRLAAPGLVVRPPGQAPGPTDQRTDDCDHECRYTPAI